MKKTRIGTTGLEVTDICFGTSALGNMPENYGYSVDEARARETLNAIFDGPANFIDTSRNYGIGESERRIGAAIAERGGLPDGFVLSTKLDRDPVSLRFDGPQVRKSLEQSLTALGIDRVHILHLHDPEHARDLSEVTATGGALDELFRMKEEGLADAVGLAMGELGMMSVLIKDWPFDAMINHNRFTLLNRSAGPIFDYAHERGITVLNAAPFASGVLAKGSDRMKRITYQEATDAALEPVRAVEAVCAEHGVATGAVALQFSMRDPRIGSTIVGVSKPERVRQTLDWAATDIPPAVWAALDALPSASQDPEANRVMPAG